MKDKNTQTVFKELTGGDDLDAIRKLFTSDTDEWFKIGVEDAAAGKAPFLTCHQEYRVGYNTQRTVMTAVALMPTMMWQRGN